MGFGVICVCGVEISNVLVFMVLLRSMPFSRLQQIHILIGRLVSTKNSSAIFLLLMWALNM